MGLNGSTESRSVRKRPDGVWDFAKTASVIPGLGNAVER